MPLATFTRRLVLPALTPLLLAACASVAPAPSTTAARLAALPAADVVLLGEQHDASAHQQIHAEVVLALASQGRLAALALEMADAGYHTAALAPNASEAAVQQALHWNDAGWPWQRYGPAVMAAVRAGVPVLGANLARAQMPAAMADASLQARLPPAALAAQQQAIREGHCQLLPESQTLPMTRIQLAKDLRMAQTLAAAAQPGQIVLLLAGAGHVDRQLGVPLHLPADLHVQAVGLRAGAAQAGDREGRFDAVWTTAALAPKDYCAAVRAPQRP